MYSVHTPQLTILFHLYPKSTRPCICHILTLVMEPLVMEPLVMEPPVMEPLGMEPLVMEPLEMEPLVMETSLV